MHPREDNILLVTRNEGDGAQLTQRAFVIQHPNESRLDTYDLLGLDKTQGADVPAVVWKLMQHDLRAYSVVILDRDFPSGTADGLLARLSPDTTCIVATSNTDMKSSLDALSQKASGSSPSFDTKNSLNELMALVNPAGDARQRVLLSERLASIGLAVASVAHESRNALQRIQTHLDLLRVNEGTPEQRLKDLRSIEEANHCLWNLFQELQEFSAPMHLAREPASLGKVIQDGWASLQGREGWTDAELTLDVSDGECWIDPVRMEQVFRNLMENALDACHDKTLLHIATTDAHWKGRRAQKITVRDNGPGVANDGIQQAFEPFYTTKSKGTGLGLSICRRIVEAHDGWIEIEPPATGGTSFLIVLPIDAPDKDSRDRSK
ncbi:Globin-coupled histidine kinase [Rosistilla ulvae]|uniref:histidine kinase n=1 Tax=Rosistilla ulvae TaxID=1930277 RepID=A0A517LXF7_9BACT|nr:ATP-binding protein [Rosistilla ulvae]QDS87305.1 Globin-coupled histidine kinase [Rosistilla ulvae]